jgi:outer membrane protein OmpA-like peptidoglycan-associated protein
VDYLISKGIYTSRMIAKGYGKTRPIAPNTLPGGKDNPEGRQLNRRTEFKVLRVTQELK